MNISNKSSMEIEDNYGRQKRKKSKRILLVILSVLVLSLVGIGIYIWINFILIQNQAAIKPEISPNLREI